VAKVVKVTTNLIVYPGLGSDEKLKLTTKLNVEATVFSDLFKNYIIQVSPNKIRVHSSLIYQMTNNNMWDCADMPPINV
jgi:hypothetical protein